MPEHSNLRSAFQQSYKIDDLWKFSYITFNSKHSINLSSCSISKTSIKSLPQITDQDTERLIKSTAGFCQGPDWNELGWEHNQVFNIITLRGKGGVPGR